MFKKSTILFLFLCFFLVSCGSNTNKTGPVSQSGEQVFRLEKPLLTATDGSDFVELTGPSPDGGKARVIVPSGKGFADAQVKQLDKDEPLFVNVNKWLSTLCGAGEINYVDPQLEVTPILRDQAEFDMTDKDIVLVNNQIQDRGFDLLVTSSKTGLNCSKKE